MVASAVLKLSVDYEQSQELPIGKAVYSDTVSVGEDSLWRVECFPRGEKVADGGKYISVFLRHMGESTSVMPVFEVCLMDRSCQHAKERPLFVTARPWRRMGMAAPGDGLSSSQELWRREITWQPMGTLHLCAPSWSSMKAPLPCRLQT